MLGEETLSFDDLFDMNKAQQNIYEIENKIKDIIDENDLMLFFKLKGEIYGTDEEGRLTYATLLDKKENIKLKKELRFSAINLTQAISDEPKEYVFSYEDIKKIKRGIIGKEKAEEELIKDKK